MSNPSRDEFLAELGRLFDSDLSTARQFFRAACDDHPRTAPVVANVADLDERKRLWHELQDASAEHGLQLGAASFALFLLCPLARLRAQVDLARISTINLVYIYANSTAIASIVLRSCTFPIPSYFSPQCSLLTTVSFTVLAKEGSGGTPSGTPRHSSPATPAKPAPAAPAEITSSPAVSSPPAKTVVSTDGVLAPGPSLPKRKASASLVDDQPAKKKKPERPQTPPPASPSPAATESPGTAAKRNRSATTATYHRDGHVCVLSGYAYPDGAHIIPFSGNKDEMARRRMLLFLDSFWGPEATAAWRLQLEDAGVTESSKNLLCMGKHIHILWGRARFALKPLRDACAAARNEVWVQLHWLRQGPWKPEDIMATETADQLMDELAGCNEGDTETSHGFAMGGSDDNDTNDRGRNGTLAHRASGIRIETGQVFVIRADDPDDLPSLDLLELQWALVRLAAMAGAANVFNDGTDDDNTDDAEAVRTAYSWGTEEVDLQNAKEEEFDGDVEPLDLERTDVSPPI